MNKFETTNIVNIPIQNYDYTLLHLICQDELGIIIKIIFDLELHDLFNVQDDDGNTPLHLLCKKANYLEKNDYYYNSYTTPLQLTLFYSEPTLNYIIKFIEYLSNFADFSIKNKEGKTPDELTENLIIHRFRINQLLNKNEGKFPNKLIYSYNSENKNILLSYKNEWKDFFKLKDEKRKNKLLLHFLCEGDRLSAVQFLVEQGADVNKKTRIEKLNKNYVSKGDTPINLLFGYNEFDVYHPFRFNNLSRRMNNDVLIKEVGYLEKIMSYMNLKEKKILEESEKIAEYLYDHGADITCKNVLGESPRCDISDIIYKLLFNKERKISTPENENNYSSNENTNELNNVDESNDIIELNDINESDNTIEQLTLNLPSSLLEKIKELSKLSNKSVDDICTEILETSVTKKIKNLQKKVSSSSSSSNNNGKRALSSPNKNKNKNKFRVTFSLNKNEREASSSSNENENKNKRMKTEHNTRKH